MRGSARSPVQSAIVPDQRQGPNRRRRSSDDSPSQDDPLRSEQRRRFRRWIDGEDGQIRGRPLDQGARITEEVGPGAPGGGRDGVDSRNAGVHQFEHLPCDQSVRQHAAGVGAGKDVHAGFDTPC